MSYKIQAPMLGPSKACSWRLGHYY